MDADSFKAHAPNLVEIFTAATNALSIAAFRCMISPGPAGHALRTTLLPHLEQIRQLADETIKIIEQVAPLAQEEEKDAHS